jgi:hypothetical protein
LKKVVAKLVELKVVRKTSDEYFSVLRIVDVTVIGKVFGLDLRRRRI